jgi:hypothetical protein
VLVKSIATSNAGEADSFDNSHLVHKHVSAQPAAELAERQPDSNISSSMHPCNPEKPAPWGNKKPVSHASALLLLY